VYKGASYFKPYSQVSDSHPDASEIAARISRYLKLFGRNIDNMKPDTYGRTHDAFFVGLANKLNHDGFRDTYGPWTAKAVKNFIRRA